MATKADIPTSAYVALATKHDEDDDDAQYELTATAVSAPSSLYVDRPVATVDSRFAGLPEAQDLTWTDTFFQDEDDGEVIAVFDFDYDQMENFNTSVGWVCLGATLLYTPFLAAALVSLTPCFLRQNVRWSTRAQHIAVTRDGIRFVNDRRKSCWGLACTDKGKSSKTVPFDKITDCNIVEPAGNTCLCVKNVLTVVNVDTASSGTEGRKELRIAGLKDPNGFKKLVWAMKRAQGSSSAAAIGAPSALSMLARDDQSGDANVASLLRDIRDELRQNNDLLQKMKASSSPAASAPGAVEIL